MRPFLFAVLVFPTSPTKPSFKQKQNARADHLTHIKDLDDWACDDPIATEILTPLHSTQVAMQQVSSWPAMSLGGFPLADRQKPDVSVSNVAEPRIASVHVLQCGRAEQHREHRYGSSAPQLWWVFFGRSWVPLPLQCFLIEHKDGLVLFDTGIDPAIVSDRTYIKMAAGRFLLPRIFKLQLTKSDRIDHVLNDMGVAASDIDTAVISHLHFDHVGGISQIPQAELIVSAREWEILSEPHPEREWILPEHIQLPTANWRAISFEPSDDPLFDAFDGTFDVKGDGSMVLLPTPGHTKGSISMLIRQSGWNPILLVADLTYEAALLDQDVVAGTGDPAALRASFAKVRTLKDRLPGLAIVASHDFTAPNLVAAAMHKSD